MRVGRRNRPAYRIVVVDSRKRRDGAYIEKIGIYQPLEEPAKVEINEERALYWLSVGAQPTPTVRDLFRKKGINKKFHELRLQKKKEKNNKIEN